MSVSCRIIGPIRKLAENPRRKTSRTAIHLSSLHDLLSHAPCELRVCKPYLSY